MTYEDNRFYLHLYVFILFFIFLLILFFNVVILIGWMFCFAIIFATETCPYFLSSFLNRQLNFQEEYC